MTNIKNAVLEEGFTLPADIQELKIYDKRNSLPVSVTNLDKLIPQSEK
jgi:hypothetical protein